MGSFRKSVSLPLPQRSALSSMRRLSSSGLKSSTSSASGTSSLSGFGIADSANAQAAEAASEAKDRFQKHMPDSLRDQTKDEQYCVAPFEWDECVLGPVLGSGQFADVFEVRSFCLEDDAELSAQEIKQRLQMKKREKYCQTKTARYALKHIKQDHLKTHQGRIKYVQAAGDLALEKEFLASLDHPHIVKLRGVARSGPTGDALILDCLVETLESRIKRWRKPAKSRRASFPARANLASLTSSFTSMVKSLSKLPSVEFLDEDDSIETTCFDRRKGLTVEQEPEPKAGGEVLRDRLGIALQIAAAMKYLHSHSIVFRDLKPANIGFNVRGDVKLFDFGLARFCSKDRGDSFQMSGAGTPRYMAPECLRGKACSMKADVYSFAIVLWEILAGKTAYMFARRKDHLMSYVVEDNGRPDIDPHWPVAAKSALERSFDVETTKRPEMEEVHGNLREALSSPQDREGTLPPDDK